MSCRNVVPLVYLSATAHSELCSYTWSHHGTGDPLEFQAKFSSEGLDIMIPGSGIRFKTGVYLDLTTTDSVTIGYTG